MTNLKTYNYYVPYYIPSPYDTTVNFNSLKNLVIRVINSIRREKR